MFSAYGGHVAVLPVPGRRSVAAPGDAHDLHRIVKSDVPAGLGEDIATNIGLNYNRIVLVGTSLVAVATGVVTVVVGNLPFLGLIVPNIVSMLRGDDLRSNLPWVCLTGIAVVTVCDLIGRTIIAPFEMPVSVILGVVGAAVFIALIVKRSRNA